MADGTLAQSLMGVAQQSNQDLGQGSQDALQAYHIAATAEHARQELEMQKQDQDMNKAKWFSSQVDGIQRLEDGPARKLLLDGFAKQLPQVYPSFNPDNIDLLKHRPELTPALAQIAANAVNGKDYQPGDLESLTAAHGTDFMAALDKQRQAKLGEMGQQVKAQAMQSGQSGRVGAMQDNATLATSDKFDKDPNILKLMPMGQSLGRDLKTLTSNDPKKPVTYQTVHETLMNVANVLGSGSLSDGRVQSITPHISDEIEKQIDTFVSDNPNQPADPRYVKYALDLVTRLHGAVKNDVGDRADQIFSGKDNPEMFNNPNIAKMAAAKHSYYKTGQWMQSQSDAAATPQVPPDVQAYADKHGISVTAAAKIKADRTQGQ